MAPEHRGGFGVLLYLLEVPIPFILLIALFTHHF
jgi:hypothetical protein